jgi:hypothetical protein
MIVTTGLLGIKRPELQYKKDALLPRWTDEEKKDINHAPYLLELKA